MTRPTVLLGSLLLAALAAGCQNVSTNAPDQVRPAFKAGVTTKRQVIEALGTPQVVRRRGDRTVLTWTTRRVEGSAVGVGNILLNFMVRDAQAEVAKYDVVFGPDNKVLFVRLGGQDSVDRPGPWPFGD